MKSNIVTTAALVAAIAMAPLSVPALAQESEQAQTSQQPSENAGETQTWKNPERIADIKDQSERIRAFSVLIGQSVYDEMLRADAANPSDADTVSDDSDQTAGVDASDDIGTDDAAQSDEAMSSDAASPEDATGQGALSDGVTVNILNLAELIGPEDVLALELLAEQNSNELASLQSVIDLDESTRAMLEDQGLVPADVVGVQRSRDMLDIFVIPGWLND